MDGPIISTELAGLPATASVLLEAADRPGGRVVTDLVRQPVQLSDVLFVAGDHRDTASQQGALASGARAARAIERQLG